MPGTKGSSFPPSPRDSAPRLPQEGHGRPYRSATITHLFMAIIVLRSCTRIPIVLLASYSFGLASEVHALQQSAAYPARSAVTWLPRQLEMDATEVDPTDRHTRGGENETHTRCVPWAAPLECNMAVSR